MSALSIQVPFPVFQDRDGQPLENGYVWIGQPNLTPQVNPVNVYFDAALTQPAAQPLRTINGYISNAGTPAQVYVDGVNFSILVQDSKGSMVYNFPEGTGISPDACGVEYSPPFTGGVPYPVCEKLAQTVSVKDFGAVGDGVTDDTAAFTNALATGKLVFVPIGTYKIVGNLRIDEGGLIGEAVGVAGGQFSQLKFYNCTDTTIGAIYNRIANQKSAFIQLENLWISGSSWDATTGALGYGLDIEAPLIATNVTVTLFKKSGVFLHNDASGNGPYESMFTTVNSVTNGQHGFLIGAGANTVTLQNCQSKWNGAPSWDVAPSVAGSYDGVYIANTSDGAGPYYSFPPTSVTILDGDFSYNSRYGINVYEGYGMWMSGEYTEQCLSADSCQHSVGAVLHNSYVDFGFVVTGAGYAVKFNNNVTALAQQNKVVANGYDYGGAVSGTRIYDKSKSVVGPSTELKDRYIYLGADDIGATNHTAILANLDGNSYYRAAGTGKHIFDTNGLYLGPAGINGLVVSGNDIKYQSSSTGKQIFPQGLYLDNAGTVKFLTGSGSPEGVVTAFAGSIYTNYLGGAGTTLYVKESAGLGNTGWVAK